MEIVEIGKEIEEVGIGAEMPPVEPKPVVVLEYGVADVKDKEGKDVGAKLVLTVKHPDVPEMEMSKVKYEKAKGLKEAALWLNKDKDGKIPFNSALATFLRFYKCSNIKDLKDKTIETTTDEGGYVIAKAY